MYVLPNENYTHTHTHGRKTKFNFPSTIWSKLCFFFFIPFDLHNLLAKQFNVVALSITSLQALRTIYAAELAFADWRATLVCQTDTDYLGSL